MAKNVTLMGASYSDVPAVNLPQTGGGTATFTDVTGTTATAADVAQGKVFYAADGTETTGTASGGSATIEPLSVTANGTYTAPSGVDGYSPVVVNVPTGGGGGGSASDPVRFIDYDGTILHSYSVADFMALTAMPENPSHSGLTSQGWNWSLADAKAQLTAYPEAGLTIGQMYITDDGKTRIYVHFEEARKSPYLGICLDGTVTVDWGDGSATDTLTGNTLVVVKMVQHVFPSAGDYVITLTVESGSFAFRGVSNTAYILRVSGTTTSNVNFVYTGAVRKIELGTGANINDYGFCRCINLETITIPTGISIKSYTFQYCYRLRSLTCPIGTTALANNTFYYCFHLSSISIPNGVTRIGASVFVNARSLKTITLPMSVQEIKDGVFTGCSNLLSLTIPNGVNAVETSAFASCENLLSVNLPDSVETMGSYVFNACYSLKSLILSHNLLSVGSSLMQNCNSLTQIVISESLTSIKSSMFSGCYCLSSITIPSSVTSIESYAFQYCTGMQEYHFLSTTPPTLAKTNVFANIPSDCIIYVPQGSLDAYKTATNWSTYASKMQEEPA